MLEAIKEAVLALTGFVSKDNPYGVAAQFESPGALLAAARALRKAGYRRFDVHSPFPIHGMDSAMGLRRSLMPWIVLGGGFTGLVVGLGLQVWIHVFEYPLVISGKPFFSLPAFIPVAFELTILLAAFGAVFGMFLINFLPMFYHPLFKYEPFSRVTDDAFFVSILARDRKFDPEQTQALLAQLGGKNISLLEP